MRMPGPQTALALLLIAGVAACSTTPPAVDSVHAPAQIKPEARESWLALGKRMMESGELVMAERAFRKSIAYEGASAQALTGLGVSAVRQGRLKEGRRFLQIARDQVPTSVVANNNLGVVLFKLEDFEGARVAFRRAFTASDRADEAAEHNLRVAESMVAALQAEQQPHPALSHTVMRTGSSEYRLVSLGDQTPDATAQVALDTPAPKPSVVETVALGPAAPRNRIALPSTRPTLLAAGIGAPAPQPVAVDAEIGPAHPAPRPADVPQRPVTTQAPDSVAVLRAEMPSRRPSLAVTGADKAKSVAAAPAELDVDLLPSPRPEKAAMEVAAAAPVPRPTPGAVPSDLDLAPPASIDHLDLSELANPSALTVPVDLAPDGADAPVARSDAGIAIATAPELPTEMTLASVEAQLRGALPGDGASGSLLAAAETLPALPAELGAELVAHSLETDGLSTLSGGYDPKRAPRKGDRRLPNARVLGFLPPHTASNLPANPVPLPMPEAFTRHKQTDAPATPAAGLGIGPDHQADGPKPHPIWRRAAPPLRYRPVEVTVVAQLFSGE
ncbi:MAG: hypothetical protein AAGG06_14375 [Pseudomonadota bacterium]